MNVVISNVPGPAAPLYAAGARMRTYWPLSIVEHGMGLNITVVSYCGALDFGLVAARCAVPDLHPLARAIEEAHAELLRLTVRAGRKGGAAARQSVAAPRRPRQDAALSGGFRRHGEPSETCTTRITGTSSARCGRPGCCASRWNGARHGSTARRWPRNRC